MTVEWVYQGYGYYSTDVKEAGSLSPASFNVDGTTYTVKMVETKGWWMYIGVDRELPFDFVLELDGTRFVSDDASFAVLQLRQHLPVGRNGPEFEGWRHR